MSPLGIHLLSRGRYLGSIGMVLTHCSACDNHVHKHDPQRFPGLSSVDGCVDPRSCDNHDHDYRNNDNNTGANNRTNFDRPHAASQQLACNRQRPQLCIHCCERPHHWTHHRGNPKASSRFSPSVGVSAIGRVHKITPCPLSPIDRSSQGPRNSQYGGQRPCHKQFDPA